MKRSMMVKCDNILSISVMPELADKLDITFDELFYYIKNDKYYLIDLMIEKGIIKQ